MSKILFFFYLFLILLFLILNILINTHPNPIFMITIILLNTITICFLISFWQSNFIYSILLFLIIISGLLIIFLYFSSLITNIQNKLSINFFILINFIINLIFFSYSRLLQSYHYLPWNTYLETFKFTFINQEIFWNLFIIYSYPYNNFTFLCIFFLLISIFTIIKICTIKSSSLRKIS
jgi:hypothetical protein